MYRQEVVRDYETREWAMYLNGELVGFARTYPEAQETLNELVIQLMSVPTISKLDEPAPDQ